MPLLSRSTAAPAALGLLLALMLACGPATGAPASKPAAVQTDEAKAIELVKPVPNEELYLAARNSTSHSTHSTRPGPTSRASANNTACRA